MVRISRLTDYGIVLMCTMATHPDAVQNATEVAAEVRLPLPTVSKLLRTLAREGLLSSHRGVKGGYSLARAPETISVAHVIRALEGPIALTMCTVESEDCEHETVCPVRRHWQKINGAIRKALDSVTLSDIAASGAPIVAPADAPVRSVLPQFG